MGDPFCVGTCSKEQLILDACLCSDFNSHPLDPIDKAILEFHNDPDILSKYAILDFVPFDPVSKRTLAHVRAENGETFIVAKGAPQVVRFFFSHSISCIFWPKMADVGHQQRFIISIRNVLRHSQLPTRRIYGSVLVCWSEISVVDQPLADRKVPFVRSDRSV